MTFRCSNCGHEEGARCSRCGREMLCGVVAVPCPRPDCLEGILEDPGYDLEGGGVEDPRVSS